MTPMVGNWHTFIFRGVAAILFGLLALIVPGITLLSLIYLFGIYAAIDGVLNLAAVGRHHGPKDRPWWLLLIQGICGIAAALISFLTPQLTAIALLYLIAAWAIITGVMAIVVAFHLRRHIPNELFLILSGGFSVLAGILAMIFPAAGALTVVLWIGIYAIAVGIMLCVLGYRVRAWSRNHIEPAIPQGGLSSSAGM
jgi:uncharacterized membrane protein HdeD (DUF308 family)